MWVLRNHLQRIRKLHDPNSWKARLELNQILHATLLKQNHLERIKPAIWRTGVPKKKARVHERNRGSPRETILWRHVLKCIEHKTRTLLMLQIISGRLWKPVLLWSFHRNWNRGHEQHGCLLPLLGKARVEAWVLSLRPSIPSGQKFKEIY